MGPVYPYRDRSRDGAWERLANRDQPQMVLIGKWTHALFRRLVARPRKRRPRKAA